MSKTRHSRKLTARNLNRHSSRRALPLISNTPRAPDATSAVYQATDFAADVAQEVVNTLTTITSGIVSGASAVVDTAGNISERVGDMCEVYATQVFKGAGSLAMTVADQLGKVLRVIPVVGGSVGYLVESTGGGVYHVIVVVGKVSSSAMKRVGKVVKKSTDLVVYTLKAGDSEMQDVGEEVNDLVGRFARGVTGRGGGRQWRRTKKGR